MMYGEVVLDFAKRTKKNLDFVREAAKKENPTEAKVYEFTQLINSMLGLLVFPKEEYYKKIEDIKFDELVDQGWPKISSSGDFSDAKTLGELLCHMRNAITHFHIEFLHEREELNGVKLWDEEYSSRRKNWEAELSQDDLEKFTNKLVELLKSESLTISPD